VKKFVLFAMLLLIAPLMNVQPAAAAETRAAVLHGWGTPIAADEFNYTGAPNPLKWSVYKSAGHGGNGLRAPSAWNGNGWYMRVTGNSAGTTGGMSAKFDKGMTYTKTEVRMRVPFRDSEYHPVLIKWPDQGRVAANNCAEIDFSESTSTTTTDKFFLHYNCSNGQSSAVKTINMAAWHNYAVDWNADRIIGYIDGVEWFRDANPAHVPDDPAHQTIQLDWFPDGTATSESAMDVNWIRVYK
jgi:hypothetical protein